MLYGRICYRRSAEQNRWVAGRLVLGRALSPGFCRQAGEMGRFVVATGGAFLIRQVVHRDDNRIKSRKQESNVNTLLSNPLKRIH